MIGALLKPFAKLYSVTHKRYVNKFIPVKQQLTPGRTTLESDQEKTIQSNLIQAINNVKSLIPQYPQIKDINELLYLDVVDVPGLKFTIRVKDGDASVTVGWDVNTQPDFLIPLYSHNIARLSSITSDKKLDVSEVYKIIRVLFIPFLRGLYQADYSHLPEDKSYMQLDNFIQVEVKEENGIKVEGFPGPARATAANVDNQWLIFEGWQGDPDIRYEMNTIQALKFAYLIRVKLIKGNPNLSELHEILEEYNQLKKDVTVYEREWH